MPALSPNEAIFLGTVLEYFFYGKIGDFGCWRCQADSRSVGVYCLVFSLYLKIRSGGGQSRVRYPIIILFILCSCYVFLDFASEFITIVSRFILLHIIACCSLIATSSFVRKAKRALLLHMGFLSQTMLCTVLSM